MTNSTGDEREQRSRELPEWAECQSAFAAGTATALTEFIRAYEPVDPDAEAFRAALKQVLNDAATSMHSLCVEKVKAMTRSVTGIQNANTVNAILHRNVLLGEVVIELESLTLDQVEQKQK